MSNAFDFNEALKREDEHLGPAQEGIRSALCISGGGIRSATFALGVLEALARRGLLDRLDYLSTVSGGGYIGSWLSAYRRNDPRPFEQLLKVPVSETRPEPGAIRFLRAFSSYLSPRLGLFSADSWTLVSIYLRNLTLNWLTLIPAMVALLLVPRLLFSISVGLPAAWLNAKVFEIPFLALVWLGVGFLAGVSAIANIGKNLPVGPDSTFDQSHYLRKCLAGLVVSAFGLSTAWGLAYTAYPGHAKDHFPLWGFLVFGTAYHLIGWLVGFFISGKSREKITVVRILLVTGAGAVGGFLAWLSVCLGFDWLFSKFVSPDGTFNENARHLTTALYFCLATPTLLAVIGGAGILYVGWTTKSTTDESQEWWARSGAWMIIAIFGWAGLAGIVLFGPALLTWAWKTCFSLLGASGLTGTLLGKSATTKPTEEQKKADKSWLSFVTDHAATVAAPIFIVLFFATISLLCHWVIFGIQNGLRLIVPTDLNLMLGELPEPFKIRDILKLCTESSPAIVLVSIALTAVFSWIFGRVLDINRYSMHGMYRNRLVRAYLGASRGKERTPNAFTGFDPKDDFPMAELATAVTRPLHIINCALNLVGGKTLAWQQRKAMSFTVSALHSGSCLLRKDGAESDISIPRLAGCYQPSARYGGGITIGTALAISGAAVNPSMGYNSSPAVSFLMALFNVRLGWWLGNPDNDATAPKSGPSFFLGSLMRELFGLTDASAPFVNLSDGGHFENLALYEMVLRQCGCIIVSDAGADPEFRFDDLGNAIRKIRIDFGIPVRFREIPISSPTAKPDGNARYFAIGEIAYDAVGGIEPPPTGYILYIKPTLLPNDGAIPADVRNYAASNPTFPHQTTADQFFDESQFESYRALGEYAMNRTLDELEVPAHDVTPALLRSRLESRFIPPT